jgi:hypothetical protein
METVTSMAPLRWDRSGWMSAHYLYLPNYGCSTSSGYATDTSTTAYRGEEEAARIYPSRSVTIENQMHPYVDEPEKIEQMVLMSIQSLYRGIGR